MRVLRKTPYAHPLRETATFQRVADRCLILRSFGIAHGQTLYSSCRHAAVFDYVAQSLNTVSNMFLIVSPPSRPPFLHSLTNFFRQASPHTHKLLLRTLRLLFTSLHSAS
jgi:hypothetical protein